MKRFFLLWIASLLIILSTACNWNVSTDPDVMEDSDNVPVRYTSVLWESESNNTYQTADYMPSKNLNFRGEIGSSTDKDWYRVSLTGGKTISLRLDDTEDNPNAYYISGEIYKIYNNVVSKIGTFSHGTWKSFTPPATGSYYFMIYGNTGISYEVILDEGNVTIRNESEPNNSHDTRDYFSNFSKSNSEIRGEIGSSTDQDWYGFYLFSGDTVDIRIDDTEDNPNSYYISGEIYNNAGDKIGTFSHRTWKEFTPGTSDYYYFKIYGGSGISYEVLTLVDK